jgi:hypothetical protein
MNSSIWFAFKEKDVDFLKIWKIVPVELFLAKS